MHFICTGLEIINLLYSTFNFSFVEYETDTTIATLATSASYLQDRFEKDDGQPTNNPHILAARIISREDLLHIMILIKYYGTKVLKLQKMN